MAEQIKYISLAGLQYETQLIHDYVDAQDAKSIKAIGISADRRTLYFYKVDNPTSETVPAFEWEAPTQEMDAFMKKVTGATVGNIAEFTADGSLKDSGIDKDDLALKKDVTKEIMEKISQAAHMKKEIVTTLPSAESADANTFYLIKLASASGKDKYEIWTKINDELVLIDDTSVDLSGYVDIATFQEALAKIKKEAVDAAVAAAAEDATKKAKQALDDAKAYTDSQIAPVNTKVNALDSTVQGIQTSITTINSTLTSHGDRITAVENTVGNIGTATNDEISAMFNAIFYPT